MSQTLRAIGCAGFLLGLALLLQASDVRPAFADDGLCVDLAADGAESEIPADVHCIVRARATIGGRAYVFAEFVGFTSRRGIDHVAIAREAVERSQPVYDPHFRLTPATIFFGNSPASGGDASLTNGLEDACVVYIDDSALDGADADPSAENELRRTIAHELFHCSQDAHPILAIAGNSREEDGWWIEGSAEYFAGLAIPESLPGRAFYDEFVAKIFSAPLYTLDYDGYVFFAFLGRERGTGAVVALLNSVTAASGETSEQSVLQSIPDFDRLLNEFARATFDGMQDESGRPLPIEPPDVDVTPLTRSVRVPRHVIPFAFGARRFSAPGNSQYLFETPEFDGPLNAALAHTPGAWRDLPTRLGSCQHETDAIVVYTSTSRRGPAEATFPIVSEPSERLADCACPIGAWMVPTSYMSDFAASINHTVTEFGSTRLTFNGNGTATWEARGIVSQYEIPNSGGAVNTIVRDYDTSWSWHVENGNLYMIQNEMTIRETSMHTMGGEAPVVRGPRERVLSPDASSGWARPFECVGGELRIGRPIRLLRSSRTGLFDPNERDYPHWGTFVH